MTAETEIQFDALMGTPLVAAGDYCEKAFSADTLKSEFDSGRLRRKTFCEFLGIGESTLTGWLQGDRPRVPRMAAEAYVQYLAIQALCAKIEKLAEPRVLEIEGRFAVVEFRNRDDGEVVGEVTAGRFTSYETARSIAESRSKRFIDDIRKCLEIARMYVDVIEDSGTDKGSAERALDRTEESVMLVSDYKEWRKSYRPTLDEL